MMNDPEAKREMEQMQQNMSVQNQVKANENYCCWYDFSQRDQEMILTSV